MVASTRIKTGVSYHFFTIYLNHIEKSHNKILKMEPLYLRNTSFINIIIVKNRNPGLFTVQL